MTDHAGPSAMSGADGSGGQELVIGSAEQLWQPSSRRNFLRLMGLGGTVVMLPGLFACNSNDSITGTTGATAVTLNLSNDVGILNYAYALEQLEAAFYTAVVASSAFSGMSAEQKEVMVDLRNHEVIHREFLKQVLGSARIGDLALNATTVAAITANTAVILKTSESFEDLGVSAYNGAGKYLTDPANLLVAGKIVSVEARHAAAIRDLREGLSLAGTPAGTRFAGDDVVNASGLDVKLEPSAVLTAVAGTNVIDMTKTSVSIGTQPATKPGTADQSPPSPTP